jgi:hypothetical protein
MVHAVGLNYNRSNQVVVIQTDLKEDVDRLISSEDLMNIVMARQ